MSGGAPRPGRLRAVWPVPRSDGNPPPPAPGPWQWPRGRRVQGWELPQEPVSPAGAPTSEDREPPLRASLGGSGLRAEKPPFTGLVQSLALREELLTSACGASPEVFHLNYTETWLPSWEIGDQSVPSRFSHV